MVHMGSVRRFSWPLDPTSDETNCDYNSNDLTTGRYIDIDNINLVVRLQTYVDDIIGSADRQTVCGKHCNQNCRLHWRRNTCRTSQPTPLQTPPTQRSANGLIARYHPNVNNEVVIDINDNTNANTVTDIKVPIVKSLISRFKSSSTSTTSDSSTTCSSCRARQSISSNSSASSSCGRSATEAGHVIANQNILTNSLSDTSSDSEIVSDISDFSDDHNSSHTSDLMFNELILGELSEMRQILEEILSNRDQLGSDFNQSNTEELFKLFGFSLSVLRSIIARL
ncbi:unnamed protein product [Medioppia subpectinata]|uniref:Uncharacterized protein n=1 Tax=Medioppia subpectinata TaxID=1979941 RepID=A0A7R9L3Z5_9ACAR|nr:unnamed protein product [Medioppia subpectinata]CAG2113982.1 unnamed protein product [Medioppia subpectinata]